MQAEPPEGEPPKRKRRWFQFSLRTLFVLTLMCAVASSWLGKKMERKRKERVAAEAVLKLGGNVVYDFQRNQANHLIPSAKPPGADYLRELFGEYFFSEVVEVRFEIKGDRPQWLNLIHETVFRDSHVDDTGLSHLEDLPGLCSLTLRRTRVADAELKHLKGLSQLRMLDLSRTSVGDAGLGSLKELAQLQTLRLYGTCVTDSSVDELQKALPNCKIIH